MNMQKRFLGSVVATSYLLGDRLNEGCESRLVLIPHAERANTNLRLLAGIMDQVLSLQEVAERLDKLRKARYCGPHPVRAVKISIRTLSVAGASIDVRAS